MARISWNRSFVALVRVEGLEPPRLASPEPKSGVSTNFTTPALKTTTNEETSQRQQTCPKELFDVGQVASPNVVHNWGPSCSQDI